MNGRKDPDAFVAKLAAKQEKLAAKKAKIAAKKAIDDEKHNNYVLTGVRLLINSALQTEKEAMKAFNERVKVEKAAKKAAKQAEKAEKAERAAASGNQIAIKIEA